MNGSCPRRDQCLGHHRAACWVAWGFGEAIVWVLATHWVLALAVGSGGQGGLGLLGAGVGCSLMLLLMGPTMLWFLC